MKVPLGRGPLAKVADDAGLLARHLEGVRAARRLRDLRTQGGGDGLEVEGLGAIVHGLPSWCVCVCV